MATIEIEMPSNMLNILRDIFESEELKIDSMRCNALKKTIDVLCVTENNSFKAMFLKISKDVESTNLKGSPGKVFIYLAEKLPVLLKDLGEVIPGSITDPILWPAGQCCCQSQH